MANCEVSPTSVLSPVDTRSEFRRFALTAFARHTLMGIPLVGIQVAAPLIAPLVMLRIINLAAGHGSARELGGWIGLVLVGAALKALAVWLGQLWMGRSALRLAHELRLRLTRNLWTSRPGQLAAWTPGDLLTRLDSDLSAAFHTLSSGLSEALRALLTFLGSLVCMASLDPRLTLWSLLLCLPAAPASLFFPRALGRLYSRSREDGSRLLEFAQRNLSAVRSLRSQAREEQQAQEFLQLSEQYAGALRRENLTSHQYELILQGLFGLSALAVMGLGWLDVAAGRLSVGGYLAFLSYAQLMVWPLSSWGWMAVSLRRGLISLDRLLEIFPDSGALREGEFGGRGGVEGELAGGGVGGVGCLLELKRLSYQRGNFWLRDLSLRIGPGEKIALVGPSGSGKTLLSRLMVGLESPPPGSVWLAGRPLEGCSPWEVSRSLGLVAQNGFVFSATVWENVAWGRPDASQAEIEAALETACLEREVAESRQGLQTPVGARGIRLSAGQRQRLCLARALLWGAPLLILDDCFSNLDRATENEILSRLGKNYPKLALVLISHRLASVRLADSLVVMEDGRFSAVGTHQEVWAQSAFYRSLERPVNP